MPITGHPQPIPAGDALLRALRLAPRPGAEWVPLAGLRGRRLAAAVDARHDLPAADTSAMDGWALRAHEADRPLVVRGESAAGHAPVGALGPGEACRISTGGLLPAGADAVLRREDGRLSDGRLVAAAPVHPGLDVRPRADDLRLGQEVLPADALVAAHEVAVVAAAGHAGALCRRRIRLALATTGDELVAPGETRPPGSVIDSNLAGLAAQAEAAGATVAETGRIPDDRRATQDALEALLSEEPEVLVTVGGISVGAHDHVGAALSEITDSWAFRGVDMRPGHPVGVALRGATVVLALPGNPAAAAVGFHVLGRALLGADDDWARTAPLREPAPRHPVATTFLRCTEDDDGLVPLPRQGAAQLSSLARADALAWIDPGPGIAPPGTGVRVSRMP